MFPWCLFYAAYFALMGVWVTFGPARLLQTAPQWAAASLALSSLVYFVALPAARLTWKRVGFPGAVAVWGCVGTLAYGLPALLPTLLPLVLPVGALAAAGAYGITETFIIEELTAQGRAHDFGPVRKWGSAGFLLAAASGGVLLDTLGGVRAMEHLLALVAVGFGGACLWLARSQRGQRTSAPAGGASAPDTGEAEPLTAETETLAVAPPPREDSPASLPPRWVVVLGLVAIALQRVGTDQTTAWFGAMWLHGNHPASQAGLLSACAVAAEFVAMQLTAGWVARVNLVRLMLLCSAISALRWWVVPGCSGFSCAAVLQGLHALSFGVFYPASLLWLKAQRPADFFAMRYVMETASRAAGSGYYYLAADALIPALGFVAVFRGCAALALMGAALWFLLPLLHRHGLHRRRGAP